MSPRSEPFVSSPEIRTLGDLGAYPVVFSQAFIVYGTLLQAVVAREWPTVKVRVARDRFWAKFSGPLSQVASAVEPEL